MSQRIELELDDLGRLVVPHQLQQQLGLFAGTTLVVEHETAEAAYLRVQTAQPQVVNKGGVLVVQANLEQDVTHFVQDERDRHISDMLRRAST